MSELVDSINPWSGDWTGAMGGVLWQSTVLALAVALVCWGLRWQSPGLRYWIWLILSAKLLVLPLWSVDVAGPAWLAERGGDLVHPAGRTEKSAPPPPNEAPMSERAVEAAPPLAAAAPAAPPWYEAATLATWLFLLWTAVVLAEFARVAWQFVQLRRMLAAARPVEIPVELLVNQCARAIGLKSLPLVRQVSVDGSPWVCGLLRPTLILPEAMVRIPLPQGERLGEGMTSDSSNCDSSEVEASRIPPLIASQETTALRTGDFGSPVLGWSHPFQGGGALRQIVLHELAHLKRRDLASVWVIHAMRTVYWFHPVAHWIAYRAGLDRELACDRVAMIHSGSSAAAYAHTLIDAAGRAAQPMVLSAAAAARLGGE